MTDEEKLCQLLQKCLKHSGKPYLRRAISDAIEEAFFFARQARYHEAYKYDPEKPNDSWACVSVTITGPLCSYKSKISDAILKLVKKERLPINITIIELLTL